MRLKREPHIPIQKIKTDLEILLDKNYYVLVNIHYWTGTQDVHVGCVRFVPPETFIGSDLIEVFEMNRQILQLDRVFQELNTFGVYADPIEMSITVFKSCAYLTIQDNKYEMTLLATKRMNGEGTSEFSLHLTNPFIEIHQR